MSTSLSLRHIGRRNGQEQLCVRLCELYLHLSNSTANLPTFSSDLSEFSEAALSSSSASTGLYWLFVFTSCASWTQSTTSWSLVTSDLILNLFYDVICLADIRTCCGACSGYPSHESFPEYLPKASCLLLAPAIKEATCSVKYHNIPFWERPTQKFPKWLFLVFLFVEVPPLVFSLSLLLNC